MSAANPFPVWKIAPALRALAAGGVIAYPTEAVYGLGCMPAAAPVRRLLAMKRRAPRKGLILVAAEPAQLDTFIDFSDPRVDWPLVLSSWPGPVTWLLPARTGLPRWLRGDHATLAVRVSAHPGVQALCRRAGAIVSTSANPAAQVPARDAARVRAYFGSRLDAVLVGALGGSQRPTEIRDGLSGTVVRPG